MYTINDFENDPWNDYHTIKSNLFSNLHIIGQNYRYGYSSKEMLIKLSNKTRTPKYHPIRMLYLLQMTLWLNVFFKYEYKICNLRFYDSEGRYYWSYDNKTLEYNFVTHIPNVCSRISIYAGCVQYSDCTFFKLEY